MSALGTSNGRTAQDLALAVALRLLRPFARLMIAQGLKFGEAAEVLKRAFVEAGRAQAEASGAVGNVSRISVSTGLHRQDVKRLLDAPIEALDRGRSLASEVYTRWLTDPQYRWKGKPRSLPMRAPEGKKSFESLARSISTDVHPRTLVEELKRLGLVEADDDGKLLRLVPDGFVPINERAGMLGLLGDNVGDHFATAVGNVLGDDLRLLEQAVYAEGVDAEAVQHIDARARAIWRDAMDALVPMLRSLVDRGSDRQRDTGAAAIALEPSDPGANAVRRSRVRIGIFMHAQALDAQAATPRPDTRRRTRRSSR